MKILSLFDGISCGRVAFERAGIPIEKYYASEILEEAISISKRNYPDIIQVGDVRLLDPNDFMDVDMIIGGSPCQNFSFCTVLLPLHESSSAAGILSNEQ